MARVLAKVAAALAALALGAQPVFAQTAAKPSTNLSGVDVVGQRLNKCADATCVKGAIEELRMTPEGLKILRALCLNTEMRRVQVAALQGAGGLMEDRFDATKGATILDQARDQEKTCGTADQVAGEPLYTLAPKAHLGPLSPELIALSAQEDSRGGGLVELICQTEGGDPNGALRNCQAKPGAEPDPILLKSAALRVQETMMVVVQKGSPKPKAHKIYSIVAPIRFKPADDAPAPPKG